MRRTFVSPVAVFVLALIGTHDAIGSGALEDCEAWPDGCHSASSLPPRIAEPSTSVPGPTPPAITRARTSYAIEGGVGAFALGTPLSFGRGIGAVTSGGGVWGVRAGVELLPWLLIEGRYFGMHNAVETALGDAPVQMLTHGALGTVRLAWPGALAVPYVFGGIGYYFTMLSGPASSRQYSGVQPTGSFGLPLGFGGEINIGPILSLGLEVAWHVMLGPRFSTRPEFAKGEAVSATAFVRIRM